MELSWQLTHTYRNPLLQVVRGVKTIAAFKIKVTDSLICLQPVLKQQLKVEKEEIMIKTINEPPSLPWKYKGKYMRCRPYAFILPINLMKYLWDHDKHNTIKQVKVWLFVVSCIVISEKSVC